MKAPFWVNRSREILPNLHIFLSCSVLFHGILRFSDVTYSCYVKVGWVWSTIISLNHDTRWHHSHSARPNLSKIWAHHHRRIRVRQHSWAYPQHLKVLKHQIYVMWKWDKSEVLLIVSTMTMGIIFTKPDPIFPKSWYHSHGCISVRPHLWDYSQHLKVLWHDIFLFCGSGMSLRYY
jgi:hypothetical protein